MIVIRMAIIITIIIIKIKNNDGDYTRKNSYDDI